MGLGPGYLNEHDNFCVLFARTYDFMHDYISTNILELFEIFIEIQKKTVKKSNRQYFKDGMRCREDWTQGSLNC